MKSFLFLFFLNIRYFKTSHYILYSSVSFLFSLLIFLWLILGTFFKFNIQFAKSIFNCANIIFKESIDVLKFQSLVFISRNFIRYFFKHAYLFNGFISLIFYLCPVLSHSKYNYFIFLSDNYQWFSNLILFTIVSAYSFIVICLCFNFVPSTHVGWYLPWDFKCSRINVTWLNCLCFCIGCLVPFLYNY